MFTDKQANSAISIRDFHYALVGENTADAYSHPKMERVEGLIEVSIEPEDTGYTPFYADGNKLYTDSSIMGINVVVNLASIPHSIKAEWFGNSYEEVDGKVSVKTSDMAKQLTFGFSSQKRDGEQAYFKFNVATPQLGTSAYRTKSETIEYQTETITFKVSGRLLDSELYTVQLSDEAGLTGFFDAVE